MTENNRERNRATFNSADAPTGRTRGLSFATNSTFFYIFGLSQSEKFKKSSFKADETDKTLLENLLYQELNMIYTSN
jgi:hypothetical protein